jgi:hypothetical protein
MWNAGAPQQFRGAVVTTAVDDDDVRIGRLMERAESFE